MNTVIRFIFSVVALIGILFIAVGFWPFVWALLLWQYGESEYGDAGDVLAYVGTVITALVLGVGGQVWWIICIVDLLEKGL